MTVRFSVADTGIGIDADTLRRLWLPFQQGDASTTRRYGGSGLGLSIVKELVTLMGGEVGVTSTVGKGSTFWFQVPLPLQMQLHPTTAASAALASDRGSSDVGASAADGRPDTSTDTGASAGAAPRDRSRGHTPTTDGSGSGDRVAPPQQASGSTAAMSQPARPSPAGASPLCTLPAAASPPPPTPTASSAAASALPARQPLILVAEDIATNVLVIKRMLARLGYTRVLVAANGKEAVDAVAAHPVDLVLMDCHMECVDGFEACRIIRRMGSDKARVPVLAVTASALDSDRRACEEAGMNGVIVKPLAIRELQAALLRYLVQHPV